MKIFLLDDSVKRLRRFRNAFCADQITHSASATEAIEWLARESFDLIFLDHDLVEHDTDWIASGTGYEVAHFLATTDTPNNQTLIVVHAMNPAGVARMLEVLRMRRVQRISIVELFHPGVIVSLIKLT